MSCLLSKKNEPIAITNMHIVNINRMIIYRLNGGTKKKIPKPTAIHKMISKICGNLDFTLEFFYKLKYN